MIKLTVVSVHPKMGMKGKKATEYDRIELASAVEDEFTGYAVFNSFKQGLFKPGDTFEVKPIQREAKQD